MRALGIGAMVVAVCLGISACVVYDSARLVTVNPCRIADSRQPRSSTNDWRQISANVRRIHVRSECGLPANTTSASLTLVAIGGGGAGFFTAYPSGSPRPEASVVNYQAGEVRAGSTLIQLSSGGYLDVYSSRTDAGLIIDTTGGFVPSASSRGGRFIAVTPRRIVDRQRINPGSSILVARPSYVPSDASAVAVSVAAINNPSGPSFITAYKHGASRPNTSILNTMPSAGATASATIVPISSTGFRLYSLAGQDVIVDITGYFTGSSAPASSLGLFHATTPTRVLDTRSTPPVAYDGGTLEVLGGFDARAVAMNWAAVSPTAPGYLTTYAARTARPGTSTLNAYPGRATGNFAIDRLSTAGVAVYALKQTHVIADMTGFFRGSPVAATRGRAPNSPPAGLIQPASGPNVGNVRCTNTTCSSHLGYDISNSRGQLWYAAGAGVVTKTHKSCSNAVKSPSPCGSTGNMVQITHDNGYLTEYYHADEGSGNVVVNVGDRVAAGQHIARTGYSGHASSYHLHFEVWDRNPSRQPAHRLQWNDGATPTKTAGGVSYRLINLNDIDPSTWQQGAPLNLP